MSGAIVNSYYAFDDSGTSFGTVAVAVTNSITSTNLLDAFVRFGDPGTITVSGVNDGTAYAADAKGKIRDAINSQSQQNWYLKNHASGTPTVTATFSANTNFIGIRVLEISGLDTTAPEDKTAGQVQSSPLPGTGTDAISSSATAATTNANDFILGLTQNTSAGDPGSGTVTAGTGFTKNGTNNHTVAESKSVTPTGVQTATFTQSVDQARITQVIAFKEAAAAASSVQPSLTTPFPNLPLSARTGLGGLALRAFYPAWSPDNGQVGAPSPAPVGLNLPYPLRSLGVKTGRGGIIPLALFPQAREFDNGFVGQQDPAPVGLNLPYPVRPIGLRTGLSGIIPRLVFPPQTFPAGVLLTSNYILSPGGFITFSGGAALIRERVQVPTGGITFSGTVAEARERVIAPSGGVVFSGTAPLVRTRIMAPTGSIVFSGSAGMTFTPAGGSPLPPTRPMTGAGI